MKRKFFLIIISIFLTINMLTGCSLNKEEKPAKEEGGKLTIITTLFPQYDFTREIVGDRARVVLLIDPGIESHTYEPTPGDIIEINKANLFIYTGKYMEPWAEKIIESIDTSKVDILDISKNITLAKAEEHEEEDHQEEKDEHHHEYDPHIWTSPINAITMVNNIVATLKELDPNNGDYYNSNGEAYINKLKELNEEFTEVMEEGKRKEIIFGDRFALYYLAKEYNIEWKAAIDSCAEDADPSPKVMTELVKEIKDKNIPVVYYAEMSNKKVAKALCDETGAKMLLFHSCHNVTKEEFEEGVTYLQLMKQNLENLKAGVN